LVYEGANESRVALQNYAHVNVLGRLPPGFLVDTDWLQAQGLTRSRIHHYVRRGWLEHLVPRVYRRPSLPPTDDHSVPLARASGSSIQVRWDVAVVSAQRLVDHPFHVGGTTALDLLGLSHFLDLGRKTRVFLYDPARTAPTWLTKLPLDAELDLKCRKLFLDDELGVEWRRLDLGTGRVGGTTDAPETVESWDHFLRIASAERATIEMMDEVGTKVGFHSADKVFESLSNLRPALLTRLLQQCRSVKARRLFLFYADRHRHAWMRRLEAQSIDLGRGKRQIAKGGRLHPKYQITVPAELMRGDDKPNAD
jgi:hypothetical protein